ncbi:MAG: NUDIX hydrolase [Treponema sp.]|uniref:NUDIX hydrolase n=1 Tax=Treponema sp. TaxID=166 RepID=UPI00298D6CFB|nr:NUDIX hydrolase [Treponema sp.]MCQ2602057.1 NUDIX hydrolase [Treponema sp.]
MSDYSFCQNSEDEKQLTWKPIQKHVKLETVIGNVTEIASESPEGSVGNYIVMDCPDWVIVIAEDKDEFLMVKQWRHGTQSLSIEFPGGVIDPGESSLEGALRELREETGCFPKTIVKLRELSPNPALFSNKVHFYYATELSQQGCQDLDEDEFLNYMRISKNEVLENMGKPPFIHGLMSSALLAYIQYKKNS